MERRDNPIGSRLLTCILLLSTACLWLPGCAAMKSGQGSDAAVRTIWQSRDQFVALEKQDRHPDLAVIANSHPAEVPGERLRRALESILVRVPGKDQPVLIFGEAEIRPVSERISEALARAAADEDVTFAFVGQYPALMGLMNERKVTTGRVFCQNGQVNVIFGDVLRDVKDTEDRRLYPFLVGSRAAGEPRKWSLAAKPGTEDIIMKRPDWIVFPIAGPVSALPVPAVTEKPVTEKPVTEKQGAADVRNSDVQPGPAAVKPAAAGRGGIEARLKVLNDLREKKLISEEEYRAKRREILDEL